MPRKTLRAEEVAASTQDLNHGREHHIRATLNRRLLFEGLDQSIAMRYRRRTVPSQEEASLNIGVTSCTGFDPMGLTGFLDRILP
jgi:hypothetical protein